MTEALTHLISVRQISRELAGLLLESAEEMRKIVKEKGGDAECLKNKVMASIFFEPSTRTSCSFQAAMQRLGGSVISISETGSSAMKGEVLEDTIVTMGCYCDVIVLRHPQKGSAALAASHSSVPLINAGDGAGEHPTQALLDLYTIFSELGCVGSVPATDESCCLPMTITLLGDLKNGRTVHSLVRLLAMYPNLRLVYISPATLQLPQDIQEEVTAISRAHTGADIEQVVLDAEDLPTVIADTDVLYVTRLQKERFGSEEEYRAVLGSYIVDSSLMTKAKQRMIVMHPLPRVNEIAKDVDSDTRAAYFRQMENGMYMRMALLQHLLCPGS